MNALALDYHPPRREWVNWPWLRSNGLAAAVALALHGALLGGLMLGWSSLDAPPVQTRTLTTQLLILPPAPEPVPVAAAPVVEPVQVPPPAPAPASLPITPPVETAKPQAEPQRQIEQAALARKRVDEQKREREQQQNAQRLREAEQHKQQEQQRLAEQQRQQVEQQRQAEQARQSAERARQAQQSAQQAAADSSQYQPLTKEAPDYPERALDKGIEGDCTVVYDVSPQGTVFNPQVQGACHPLFIRPSLAAAQTFRYQPRIVDGKAVTVSGVKNTFHYRIK
ncbi:putative TonB protein [Pseudomonas caricapapayae]|uniref:Protein TonB n=1 Tax=Pseudomonas caricapapayae TaxID=46678 RepID=A0A3M6F6R6_9PSED|nr:energy transducer TonB [Pseudomonas caricapapayae]RMV75947.1 putative TonB protein [Pseudomonas caricapapayae]